jgi:hypothetical protein
LKWLTIPLPSCLPIRNPVPQSLPALRALAACVDKTSCLGNDVPLKDILPDLRVLRNRTWLQSRWFLMVIIIILTVGIVLLKSWLRFDNVGDGLERCLNRDVNYMRDTSGAQGQPL